MKYALIWVVVLAVALAFTCGLVLAGEEKKPEEPKKPEETEKPKDSEKPKEPEKPKDPEKPKEPEKPKADVGKILSIPDDLEEKNKPLADLLTALVKAILEGNKEAGKALFTEKAWSEGKSTGKSFFDICVHLKLKKVVMLNCGFDVQGGGAYVNFDMETEGKAKGGTTSFSFEANLEKSGDKWVIKELKQH